MKPVHKLAALIVRLGMVRVVIALAAINIAWSLLSNLALHMYLSDDPFAKGWMFAIITPSALALVVAVPADILLIALARSLTEQRDALDQIAHIDHLTGLPNRRHFEARFKDLNQPEQIEGVFMVLDIDHFKEINDAFGHVLGDAVLAELGAVLRQELREEDLIGRLGGEEFGVFLPHCDIESAISIAQRVRAQVGEITIPHEAAARRVITISIGLASSSFCASYEDYYRFADAALYKAKSTGRNKEVIFDPISKEFAQDMAHSKTIKFSA